MTRCFAFVWQTPIEFLHVAYAPDDWIGVLLKVRRGGSAAQRLGEVTLVASPTFQAWLRAANAGGCCVYVSVNAVTPNQRSRRREAISTVRHIFLDVDGNAGGVLRAMVRRPDLPPPAYVLHTSPDHAQVLWRVSGFAPTAAERLQKHLARELGGDPAATSVAQMARLPGFYNRKHDAAPCVDVDYAADRRIYTPADFPDVPDVPREPKGRQPTCQSGDALERARRYIASVPPAVAGAHGDVHTFRLCCRLVRGFGLTDAVRHVAGVPRYLFRTAMANLRAAIGAAVRGVRCAVGVEQPLRASVVRTRSASQTQERHAIRS